jgi:hypothetical protein
VAQSIKTGRGTYHLKSAAPPEYGGDTWTLTIALERADGIEKIALRCRVPAPAENDGGESFALEKLFRHIALRIERDFEHLREEALKSIRTDRRLFEVAFDAIDHGTL